MNIQCEHWQESTAPNAGLCALGLHGGRPSVGTCRVCKHYKGENKSIVELGMSFAKAMTSRGLINNRVELPVFTVRTKSCHGDATTPPCAVRLWNEEQGFHYCDACQCAAKRLGALSQHGSTVDKPVVDYNGPYIKLHYPKLTCPLKRDGFTD